jgi:tripartite ATP-independent transporter DctM subunit
LVEISPELVVILMFGLALTCILLGYPLAIVLGGVAMFVGLIALGPPVFNLFMRRVYKFFGDYVLLALPLFIFMGVMVEGSGAAEKLYGGLYILFGKVRGGLAIGTILMGTILAACVGLIAASETMIALIAAPSMLKRGYNKEIVCGSICAGGALGILIPPSVMLVVYGPNAAISVGRLFMAAFIPGFLLSGLYVTYLVIRCWRKPELTPSISEEEGRVPFLGKIRIFMTGIAPPLFLMLAVLGTIFFGIASPTEAAAIGCVAAVILAIAYRNLNFTSIKRALVQTARFTSLTMLIGGGASMFTSVFLRLGGGEVVENLILSAPGERWGAFAVIMLVAFLLGMFIDWLGIIFILVPLVTPIGAALGFDSLWFAGMIILNLQMSFMTPPFAYTIFYLKAIAKPEWGIYTMHIIRGVIPYVVLIMIALGLCIAFPNIILWLPRMMIKA